jgi:hypothetical protein
VLAEKEKGSLVFSKKILTWYSKKMQKRYRVRGAKPHLGNPDSKRKAAITKNDIVSLAMRDIQYGTGIAHLIITHVMATFNVESPISPRTPIKYEDPAQIPNMHRRGHES